MSILPLIFGGYTSIYSLLSDHLRSQIITQMCKIDKDGDFYPRPPHLFRVIYIEHVAVYFLKLILNRFISYIMDRKKVITFSH